MEPYEVRYRGTEDVTIMKWKVKPGCNVDLEKILCVCQAVTSKKIYRLKSDRCGTVTETLVEEGKIILSGDRIALVELCSHPTVWRNMCAMCGTYLAGKETCTASVAMEHTIPDLLVSETEAQILGREDETRLLKTRQLVLLVDLDQTLIHTTNDNIPNNLKDVYHFRLHHGRDLRWYHTKFRPGTEKFLENISKLFELHICTFGVRSYAHMIARFLDPDGKYFGQRILSRDECFHPSLKTSNLKALFPCGDSMVCIIDDREDVWRSAPNLIHVKPYRFFDGTADINAPPEADKTTPETAAGDLSEDAIVYQRPPRRQAKVVKVRRKKVPEQKRKASKMKEGETEQEEEETPVRNWDDTDKAAAGPDRLEDARDGCGDDSEVRAAESNGEDVDGNPKRNVELTERKPTDHGTEEEELEEEVEMIEWEDLDDYLVYLEEKLRRIHAAFYEMHDEVKKNKSAPTPDLKKIVPYVRKKVLRGANILFSSVFPTNQPPESAHAYQLALALGANVHQNLVPSGAAEEPTTHLVAAKLGTEKVRMVKESKAKDSKVKDIKVVNPEWLWTCADRWEWVDECLFPLTDETSRLFLPQEGLDPKSGQRSGPVPNKSTTNGAEGAAEESMEYSNSLHSENIISSVMRRQMMEDVEQELSESDDDEEEEGQKKADQRVTREAEDDADMEEERADRMLRDRVLRKRKLEESSSDEGSLSGDIPKGWQVSNPAKKWRRNESDEEAEEEEEGDENYGIEEDTLSDDSNSGDTDASSVDEMANILERDYLS